MYACLNDMRLLNNKIIIRGKAPRMFVRSGGNYRIIKSLLEEPRKIRGAEGGNRTPMGLLPPDFESGASTNSTTSAFNL
jgi:hypothetical protein